jgi:hypothetical protein
LILYDQNYNFLGISSETVNFLGYEDIKEFLSINNDFANLLVQKEGKIYKFKNFSWIDFILYSGAPNKLATVTLKDGSEIDIKLTVKEITFAKELGGFEKCYAVRIISDKFVNIASKVNENMKFEVNSNVSLSNLLTEDQPALKEIKKAKESVVDPIQEEISLSFNKPKIEDEISIPTFDFPPVEELKKDMDDDTILQEIDITPEKDEEEEIKFDFPSSKELHFDEDEGIKLDLTSDEFQEESLINEDNIESTQTEEFTRKVDNIESTQTEEFTRKVDIDKPTTEIQTDDSPAFNLNFLKKVDEDEDDFISINQNQENEAAKIKPQVPQETNLNFLKKYTKSEETKSEEMQSEVKNNKQEIITQIKNDINEIDEQSSDKDDESISNITSGSFVRNIFNDNEDLKDTNKFENPELIADFISESQINIEQLKSFLTLDNYKSALYPIAKMNASADILNLNDIISSLNSIKSSADLGEKESILNNINLLEDKLNILNSKIKQEAAFS